MNIVCEYRYFQFEGRSEAGDRMAMWRRIVLGDVLAEHVVELRGRARVWP